MKLTLSVGKRLDDEVEGVLRLGNNKLLEESLKKLVNLIGLEEFLDLIHVIVFLKFVHIFNNYNVLINVIIIFLPR
jgi:hypothetical protein